MILKSTDGHNSCVEVTKLERPDGMVSVRFYSTYERARHPEWESNSKTLYLDEVGVKLLVQALNNPA